MKYEVVGGEMVCTGTWPKTKKAALKSSIEKWKTIVLFLEKDRLALAPYADCSTCALCHLYSVEESGFNPDCTRCPVYYKTGITGCAGTPFDAFYDAHDRGTELRAARREVRFLESLL